MKNEFIAWDMRKRRFISPYDVAVNGEGDIYEFERSESADGYISEVYHIELLEYSCKKDRTGRKLYKGDIIKVELDEFTGSAMSRDLEEKIIIGVIVIRPSEGARILVKKIIPEGIRGITKGRTLRIKQDRDVRIGHIYTNPELIEEDSEVKE